MRVGMASAAIRRALGLQRSPLNWSGEEGFARDLSKATRRLISSQPHAIDVHKEGAEEVQPSSEMPVLPRAWSHERSTSQIVAPKGKQRLFLVDTLALVRCALALTLGSLGFSVVGFGV